MDFDEAEDQLVIFLMTSGPSTPQRCATPFYLGSLLAAMDCDVKIFFTMEGVRLLQKGVPEKLTAMEGGKYIHTFMQEAKRSGVELIGCKPALPGYELEPGELIDEVDEVANAGRLADLILSCDKLITF
ncbi:DsrE family protein [Thiohalorhabdus sp. Cl-TMA]|uniref:DsrE family protein n=1 Tax=Thiohalorhabdus methylotrophus TaxID=3242694 RepID=A0ABV4TRC2_9GAMM